MKDLICISVLLLNINNIIAQNWSTPIVIGNSNFATRTELIVDIENMIHVVFEMNDRDDFNQDDIYYTYFNGDEWAQQENISLTDSTSIYPHIKVDKMNSIHVVWGEPISPETVDILYRVKSGGEWSTSINLFHESNTRYPIGKIGYEFDSMNRLHLIFMHWPDIKHGYVENNVLSDVKIIKRFAFKQDFKIYKDSIYFTYISAPVNSEESIYFRSYHVDNIIADTSFMSETDIIRNIEGHPIRNPQIFVDSNGRIHLIWIEGVDFTAWANEIYHMYSDDGVNWSEAIDITHNSGTSHFPGVVIDSSDNIHVVWAQSVYRSSVQTQYIGYVYYNGESWSEPESVLSPVNSWPSLAIDKEDYLHISYDVKLNGEHKVVYSTTRPSTVNIDRNSEDIPEKFELQQNYPNPFNSSTTISFSLTSTEEVSLGIYSINGEIIKKIINKNILTPGVYSVQWNGTDGMGNSMSSGIYLYRIKTDNQVVTNKMVLLK